MSEASAPAIRRLSVPEFTALLAVLFATIAFSIDAMLPALPEIAAELTPGAVNRAQLVLTAFVLGMGVGTFLAGPISDAFGRKRTITVAAGLYIVAAFVAGRADSLEFLLAARFVQGLGASGPRIVGLAMVRDLYAGREMAKVVSFVMMIFILIPAVAPLIGSYIIDWAGWRAVFDAFMVFGVIGVTWLNIRQPETLPPERRLPMRGAVILAGLREVLGNRQVVIYIAVLTLGFGQMFAFLSSTQQLFSEVYGRAESFPRWFALMAVLSGAGSILNARFVMRLGMRRIATAAYAMQSVVSLLMLILTVAGLMPGWLAFPAFFFWAVSVFFMAGVTFGNLNALALQPLGHIAGLAASVVGAVSTVLAVAIAAPIGLVYDGTALPLMVAVLICSVIAWALMRQTEDRG